MNESDFPPRLRSSNDPAIREVVSALAEDAITPERAAHALTRLDASVALEAGAMRASRGGRWPLVAKVFLASIAMFGAFGVVTRVYRVGDEPSPPPAMAAQPEREPVTLRIEDLPSATPPVEDPLPEPQTSPTASVKVRKKIAPAASASASTFREELALVQAARASLKGGDPQACLDALERYDRRYHGLFGDEVVVMRIEALIARGERERALTIADAFDAKQPDSPYGTRIRSLLAKPH